MLLMSEVPLWLRSAAVAGKEAPHRVGIERGEFKTDPPFRESGAVSGGWARGRKMGGVGKWQNDTHYFWGSLHRRVPQRRRLIFIAANVSINCFWHK